MTSDQRLKKHLDTFQGEFLQRIDIINKQLQALSQDLSPELARLKVASIASEARNIKVSAQAIQLNALAELAHQMELAFTNFEQDPGLLSEKIIRDAQEQSAYLCQIMDTCKQSLGQPSDTTETVPTAAIEEKVPTQEPSNPIREQILDTFLNELNEKCQIITEGLLSLEKRSPQEPDFDKILAELFRAAHNIKGAARGVGVLAIGDIAHHLETLFSSLQKKTLNISPDLISRSLKAVDAMQTAMQCFIDNHPLSFDLGQLLTSISGETGQPSPRAPAVVNSAPTSAQEAPTPHRDTGPSPAADSLRVSLKTIERISAYMEDLLVSKIAMENNYVELVHMNASGSQFVKSWKKDSMKFSAGDFFRSPEEFQDFLQQTIKGMINLAHGMERLQKNMSAGINELVVAFNTLQDEVRTLRLIPVATLLRTLPRTVRDLCLSLHKEVNLSLNDNNVSIDNLVLEALKDPINHILRNAIDHGIESPEERERLGKPKQASISITVQQEGSQIIFSITDDGAGINLEKVGKTAVKNNVITAAELEKMTREEVQNLIFRPNFSTADKVTEVSGRGYGLDIVRTNLLALKGNVSFKTEAGLGTTFYLQVPLTLTTERGLIVQCNDEFFAIPIDAVLRVLLIKPEDVLDIEGCQAILLEDQQPVTLFSLAYILHLHLNLVSHNEFRYVVVVKKNFHTIALIVDDVIDEREIVVKPLQTPLTNIPGVIGATLSGNAQIIFVLNSNYLVEEAMHSRTIPATAAKASL